MSPEHCLKLDRWQGPPHINKARQVSSCIVCSCSREVFVYSVCFDLKQSTTSQKLRNAPLNLHHVSSQCFGSFVFFFCFFLMSYPNLERADERHCLSILFIWKLTKARGQRLIC